MKSKSIFTVKSLKRGILFGLIMGALSFVSSNLIASGTSCSTAANIYIDSTQTFHAFTVQDSITWYSITGNGNKCRMAMKPGNGASNAVAISRIELFKGSCDSLTFINSWSFHPDDSLSFDFGVLHDNETYFLQVTRQIDDQTIVDVSLTNTPQINLSYTIPSGYPTPSFYSTCFEHTSDLDLIVSIHIQHLHPSTTSVLNIVCPSGVIITDFHSNGYLTTSPMIPPSQSTVSVLSINGNNLGNDITITLNINANSCSLGDNYIYVDVDPSSASNTFFTSDHPKAGGTPTPDNFLLLPIEEPHVSFITDNTAGTLTPSHNEETFLRYDIIHRYYKLRATSGIADYFSLDVTPEPDIEIQKIEAIPTNATDPETVTPLEVIYSGSLTSEQRFIFSDGTTQTPSSNIYVPIGHCYGSGSEPNYIFPGSNSDILIRETIRILSVNTCDNLPNRATLYHVAVHCDHTPATTSECPLSIMPKTLNVKCEPVSTELTINSDDNSLSTCDRNNFNIVVTNGNGQANPIGSGTIEITEISFAINFSLFEFSSINIGGVNLTENNGYTIIDGRIIIDPSYFSLSSTGLKNSLNPNAPWGNTYSYTNQFVFLPEGSQFTITLNELHFIGCALMQSCDPPALTLTSPSDPGIRFSYRTMCEMADALYPDPQTTTVDWKLVNEFAGSATSWSDNPPGVSDNSTVKITYTVQNAATENSTPWNLTSNTGSHIIMCSHISYKAILRFPSYYTFISVNVADPNSSNWTAAAFQLLSPGEVLIDWSQVTGLADRAFVSLNVELNFPHCTDDWGPDKIEISFVASCNDCETPCNRTYGCSDWTLYRHCGGPCDNAFINTLYERGETTLERTTFGWQNRQFYEAGNSTLSSADVTASDLLHFYDSDVFHVSSRGSISIPSQPASPAVTQINFNLEYDSPNNSDLFLFLGDGTHSTVGSMVVTPISPSPFVSNGPFTVNIDATNALFDPATHAYGISSGVNYQIHPDMAFTPYAPGNLTPLNTILQYPCDFRFEGDFRINDHESNQIADGVHRFPVYCYFSYDDIQGTHYSCDQETKNIVYYKVTTYLRAQHVGLVGPDWAFGQESGNHYRGNASELRFVFYTDPQGGLLNSDDFPNEYRPLVKWPDQMTFRVPHNEYFYDPNDPTNPLNPYAGFANAYWSTSTYFPGTITPDWNWYSQPNCNVVLTSGTTEDIITVSRLLNDSYHAATVDKAPVVQGTLAYQGFALYLTRKCPINDNPVTHYLSNDPNANLSIDNTLSTPDLNITTHAYSLDAASHSLLSLVNNSPTLFRSFHYDATNTTIMGNREFHRIDLSFPAFPIIGTTRNLRIPFSFDHAGLGYEFANMWTYFTPSHGSMNFIGFTPTPAQACYIDAFAGTPTLYQLSDLLFYHNHNPRLYAIDINTDHHPLNCELALNYTCDGDQSSPYDEVRFKINYGNSCDGYHGLSGTSGASSDFANSYTPCLFQSQEIVVLPQHSTIEVRNESATYPSNSCDLILDFEVVNLNAGETSNAIFNIDAPPGYLPVPSTLSGGSFVEVINTFSQNVVATIPLGSLSHPFYQVNNVVSDAATNAHGIYFATGEQGVYLHYHIIYRPACVNPGNYDYYFSINHISGISSCNEPVPPGNDKVTPRTPYTVPSSSICSATPPGVIRVIDPSCTGGNDGQIFVSPITNASYAWTPVGGTSPTATGLSAGIGYSCTIIYNSCTWTLGPVTLTNPSPTTTSISTTQPTTFCQGGSISLLAEDGMSYLWSNSATTQSINITTSGSYSVTVTNQQGCTATSNIIDVTVHPTPATPQISVREGNLILCPGKDVTLISSSAADYLWSNSETTNSITVSNAGNYQVTISDQYGCTAVSAITHVSSSIAPSLPLITIASGSNPQICPGGSIQLSSTVESSYLWSNSATTQTIVVSSAGTYTVTVSNAAGCSEMSQGFTVTNAESPSKPIITPGSSTSFCQGGSVILTSSEATGYLWSTSSTTSSITVSTSGSYTVTISNPSGCTSSNATLVTVNANPATPTITPGSSTSFCQGGNVSLSSSAASGYLWSNSATTQSINVTTSGSYSVTVTNQQGCTATSATTQVTVNTNPTPPNISVQSGNICEAGTITLTSDAPGSGIIYQWSNGATTQSIDITDRSTYTLTITNGSGCSVSTSYTPAQPLSTAPTVKDACHGNNGTLSVYISGGTPPFNLDLHYSGGSTAHYGQYISEQQISNLPPGTYNVTIADQNGCTKTFQIVIGVGLESITINANPGCINSNSSQATVVTFQGGTAPYIYLWSNSATTSSISSLSTGTYTCTVTDNNHCSASASIVINENPNCCGEYSQTLNQTIIDNFIDHPPTTNWGGWNLNTNVVIAPLSSGNNTLTITGADIVIAQSKTITVAAGATLIIENSTLRACNNLWGGIVVQQGGTLIVQTASTLRDALTAVFNTHGANISVSNSHLIGNNIGIFLRDADYSGTFTITGSDINGGILQSGSYATTGIKLIHVTGTNVGDPGANSNTFSDSKYGIFADRSRIGVFNNSFLNFLNSHSATPATAIQVEQPTGVSAELSVQIGGSGTNEKNEFTNCAYGIVSSNTSLYARNNTMQSVAYGVRVISSKSKEITIRENIINDSYIGISAIQNKYSNVQIIGNEIIGNSGSQTGIYATDFSVTSGHLRVEDNTIWSYGHYGIQVQNHTNAHVNENKVYLRKPIDPYGMHYGISSENCNSPAVGCNISSSNYINLAQFGPNAYLRTAISFSFCPGSVVAGNQTNFTQKGLEFVSSCFGSSVNGNTMMRHTDGLIIGRGLINGNLISGEIGHQRGPDPDHTPGNIYEGDGNGNFNHAATYSIFSDGGAYDFWVNSGLYQPLTNAYVGGSPLLPNSRPEDPFQADCRISHDIDGLRSTEDGWQETEQMILDTTYWQTSEDLMRWIMGKEIYEKLLFNAQNWLDSSVVLQQYFDSLSLVNMGKLGNVKYAINFVYDDKDSNLTSEIIRTRIDSAKEINDLINPHEIYEQNEYELNNVYLDFMYPDKEGEISEQNETKLWTIANQCPFVGGTAVYEARALLALIHDSLIFNDDLLCSSINLRKQSQNAKEEIQFDFYPNPSSSEITIEYDLKNYKDAEVELIDALGNRKAIYNLSEQEHSRALNISSLSNGIYYLKLFTRHEIVKVKKLTIIK